MTQQDATAEYDSKVTRFLEALWGEGFLSPGGPDEVDRVLENVSLERLTGLDIGCGTGGVTKHLVVRHNAAHVTGFDVARPLIRAAQKRAAQHRLGDRLTFVHGQSGPLPFEDASMDFVFSKDAILHVPDKPALFAEIWRVLKPGGFFSASDWLIGHDHEPSDDMKAYLVAEGLSFHMASPEFYRNALDAAGFASIQLRERNSWYRNEARAEIERLQTSMRDVYSSVEGSRYLNRNILIWTAMLKVLDSGEHRPTHLLAWKART